MLKLSSNKELCTCIMYILGFTVLVVKAGMNNMTWGHDARPRLVFASSRRRL